MFISEIYICIMNLIIVFTKAPNDLVIQRKHFFCHKKRYLYEAWKILCSISLNPFPAQVRAHLIHTRCGKVFNDIINMAFSSIQYYIFWHRSTIQLITMIRLYSKSYWQFQFSDDQVNSYKKNFFCNECKLL